MYEPIKPRRHRRKRKFEETDIETPNNEIDDDQNDDNNNKNDDHNLTFMKPSNKRRRTNGMNAAVPILQPELEEDIYCNPLEQQSKVQKLIKNEENDNDRIEAPYTHLVHPYLRNKNRNTDNDNDNDNERDKSPEDMLSELKLDGFELKNKGNESVNDWKNSIESQLNAARNQPTSIEELCHRISQSSGLGRDILIAKLRKSLPQEEFEEIFRLMDIRDR